MGMLQSPASEASSVGMLRSTPGSASKEEPLNCGEVSEDESFPCLPVPCPRGCCSSSFDGVSRSMATGSRHAEMLQSPASREDYRSVMTASTPCAMVMSCETKVASPPKLELGDVPPSDEALSLECDTLLRIAEDDEIHDMITCSATSSGDGFPLAMQCAKLLGGTLRLELLPAESAVVAELRLPRVKLAAPTADSSSEEPKTDGGGGTAPGDI